MKKFISLLIGVIALLFASCTHLNKAFPEELEPYLPYTESQVVKFQSADNDTLEVQIKQVITDKEEKVSWFCKCWRSGAEKFIGAYWASETPKARFNYIFHVEKRYAAFDLELTIFNEQKGSIFCEYEKLIECSPFINGVSEMIGESVTLESAEGNAIVVKGKGIKEFTIGGTKWTLIDQQKQ